MSFHSERWDWLVYCLRVGTINHFFLYIMEAGRYPSLRRIKSRLHQSNFIATDHLHTGCTKVGRLDRLNCRWWFFFKKVGHSRPLLFIFVFSIQLIINKCSIKFCQWLESNRGPLVSKATALPTEPQPLPNCSWCYKTFFWEESSSI